MWRSRNDDIRKYLLDIKYCKYKNAFWDVNNKKWRKWCKFAHISYLNKDG
jgi:hypothetical protein